MSSYFPTPDECSRHTIFPGVQIRTCATGRMMVRSSSWRPAPSSRSTPTRTTRSACCCKAGCGSSSATRRRCSAPAMCGASPAGSSTASSPWKAPPASIHVFFFPPRSRGRLVMSGPLAAWHGRRLSPASVPFPHRHAMSFENNLDRPLLPETPRDRLGELAREPVYLEDRTYWITRPRTVRQPARQPNRPHTFALDEYMPYWADLWPAARMLAKCDPARDLAGRAARRWRSAAAWGCPASSPCRWACASPSATTTPRALHFAADNARLNGFDELRHAANGLALSRRRSCRCRCCWRRT